LDRDSEAFFQPPSDGLPRSAGGDHGGKALSFFRHADVERDASRPRLAIAKSMTKPSQAAVLAPEPRPAIESRELVREACRRFPDRVALVTDRVRWTYAELGDRVRRLSTLLDTLGVSARDTVGVIVSKRSELLYETRLATFEHGAALLGINPTLPPPDIHRMLQSVDPRVVVYDADLFPDAPALLGRAAPSARALAASGPAGDYEGLLARTESRESSHTIDPSALAALGFTSGTTGAPKGITAAHRGLAECCRMFIEVLSHRGVEGPGGFFNAMPLFAAGGGVIVPSLHAGLTMYVSDEFHAQGALQLLSREKIAATFLTPSMLIDLLDEPDLERMDLSALKMIIYGSASTPAAKVEEAVRRLGPILLQGYGMSECLPPVAVLWPEEHGTRELPAPRDVLRSAGHPFEGVRVRIESESGALLPTGQTGEVAILSPTVSPGYWSDPERTSRAMRGGWWHSGDVGYVDAEGRLCILDRQQDVLKRGGRTIFPRTIEEAASEHPAVKEVCVVHPSGSERIVAAVSLRKRARRLPESEKLAETLMEFLADRIRPADLPDDIYVFEELPRSVQGKVLKREVRDALGAVYR
jgi:fatty-acyl-CoA synthase